MNKNYIIGLCMFFFLINISFAISLETVYNPFTNTLDYINTDGINESFANSTYILQSNEANLNVNSSVFWGIYNSITQLNYKILSYWANITGRPTHLTNFTNDLTSMNNNINFNANNITNIESIHFNTTGFEDTTTEGVIKWNADKQTLDIVTGLGNVIQTGQETTFSVKNAASRALVDGDIVYVTGASGEMITVDIANSSDGSKIHQIGMATTSCNTNAICQVTFLGEIHNVNTSAYAEGTQLYLADDGSFTDIVPTPPKYNIHIGQVIKQNAVDGVIVFIPEIDIGDGVVMNSLYINTNLTVVNNVNADWFNGKFNWTVGDDWATFDGSEWLFNDSKLSTIYYNATTVNAVVGTTAGSLILTQHQNGDYDGRTFNITEAGATPGLDIRFNFTDGITEFTQGIIRYRTSLVTTTNPVIIQLWDYEDGAWEDYNELMEQPTFATIEQSVFDDSEHVQNGTVRMRLYKAQAGNTNNKYFIDWLAIAKGFGVPAGNEVDPVSIHKDGTVQLTANWYAGLYNITSSYYFGNVYWNNLTGYPSACPAGSAITQLDDSVTCSAFTVDSELQSVNASVVNAQSRINSLNSTKLDATDQRYNDTAAIALKLDITDQRYNDSAAISLVDGRVDSVNATAVAKASPGTCASGTVVQNTTTSGVQCVAMSVGGGMDWATPVNASIIPVADDTYSLGNSTKQFDDLYIDGIIYADDIRTDSSIYYESDVTKRIRFSQATEINFDLGSSAKLTMHYDDGGGVDYFTFNPQGYDIDWQFLGNSDDNMFYLNAGTDKVGIGTNAPTQKLDVRGNQSITGFINQTVTGVTRHFSNGCYEQVNATGVFWIC